MVCTEYYKIRITPFVRMPRHTVVFEKMKSRRMYYEQEGHTFFVFHEPKGIH